MTDWKAGAESLAGELAAAGAVSDPAWRAAFAVTPRHVFVPRFYKLDEYNQPRTMLHGHDPGCRDEWLRTVYRDQVLVTHYRVVGTMPDGAEARVATSSASMPSLVARMLDRLAVRDGQRVLEIGTGTGYNAALLCARLGEERVASVEVDATAAAEAAEALHTAGWRPVLVVGDGAAGHPGRAPYDRIVATCSVDHIPGAWIDQLADGGLLVTPLTLAGGPLAVLRKTVDGELTGRLDAASAYCMAMRPPGFASHAPAGVPEQREPAHHTTTGVPPTAWDRPDFRLWHALHQPDARVAEDTDGQGRRTGVVVYTTTSRAAVGYAAGQAGSWPVTQDTTRLWDTVEAAWATWQQHHQPSRTRIGITARPDHQYAWLDQPDSPFRLPLTPR